MWIPNKRSSTEAKKPRAAQLASCGSRNPCKAYLPAPVRNQVYRKRNQTMVSTNQINFPFQLYFDKMFIEFAFLWGF